MGRVMETITIHLEIEKWGGVYEISDGEDIEHEAKTLAEAYLQLAKMLAEKSDCYFKLGMNELQERINRLEADA